MVNCIVVHTLSVPGGGEGNWGEGYFHSLLHYKSVHSARSHPYPKPLQELVVLTTLATLMGMLPSMVHQILHPTPKGLLYAMTNTSFAFFMFSYQVCRPSYPPPPPPRPRVSRRL